MRPIQREDTGAFAALTGEKSMWVYFTRDLSVADELTNWVNEAIVQTRNKTKFIYTMIDPQTNNILGSTSFLNLSERDKRVEIGSTWIGPTFQGKGFNDRAKYLMLKHCFEDHDFERVEFKTDVLNVPARKAFVRMGITEEGILRSHTLMTNNRRRDTIYYSVLRPEWNDLSLNKRV